MSEVFFLIWACGSSWTLYRLEDMSFHGGAVIFETSKLSTVGNFGRNAYNLAVGNFGRNAYNLAVWLLPEVQPGLMIWGRVPSGVFCQSIMG